MSHKVKGKMMTIGVAILLGLIQGFTEFFPVSSSGHLALFGHWFGMAEPDLAFDVLIHLATLAAIIVYFRRDWIQLGKSLFGKDRGDLPPYALGLLLLSMVPAGLVGVFLKDKVEWTHSQPKLVGLFLLLNGLMLLVGMKVGRGKIPMEKIGWRKVLWISLAQAVAILPGVSRSGSTIMTGLVLGLERKAAARFSFFMAVPVIGGAGFLTLVHLFKHLDALKAGLGLAYAAGFVAALLSGFVALAFLMRLLEGRRFFLFGFYSIAMGLFAIFFGG